MTISGYASLGRTVSELVLATERHLYTNNRGQLNKLNDSGGIASGDGTLTFEFPSGGLRQGAYIEIDDEIMFVWSVAGQVATIERAMLNTTAASHADNALIRVAPRFYRKQVLDALRDEITSWPPQLFAVLQGGLSAVGSARSIDLAGVAAGTRGLRLLSVRRETTEGSSLPTRWRTVDGVRLESAADLTDYPSGWALSWPGHFSEATSLQVGLGGPFNTSSFVSGTDLGTIGLTASMLDIPPIGAAVRLLFPTEIGRTDDAAQGRARLADEVPPGAASRTAQELLGWRDRRLSEEILRLVNDYPWRDAT